MRFCWTTIHVKSMEDSLRFYKEIVGLEEVNRFSAGPDMEIVFLGRGETKIELICNKSHGDINIGKDISIGFIVDSLEEKIKLIEEKGIKMLSGIVQPNPHTKFFFVMDPNGLTVQFVEQK